MPVKALMLLLVFTFILWGVNDVYRNSGNSNNVLTVNDASYSVQQFAKIYKQKVEELRQMYGYNISEEDLQNYKDIVLRDLVNRTLLVEEAQKLGLAVSDDMVKYQIASQPAFKGKDGKFDKDKFDAILQNAGLSEAMLLKNIKDEMALSTLVSPFSMYNLPSAIVIDQINRVLNLKREVTLYTVKNEALKNLATPTDEQLEATLKKNAQQFSVPEIRKASYIKFGVSDVDQVVTISDAELKENYESKILMFTTPESRKLEQLAFSSLEQAQKAKQLSAEGKSFADIAKIMEPVNKDIAFGENITKDAFESEMGEKIFSTPPHQVSEPIPSPLGFHVFYIAEVYPAKVQPFEQIKEQLHKQLVDEKLFERVSELAQKIDNDIANNLTLQEIATSYNLQVKNVELKKLQEPIKTIEFTETEGFRTVVFNTPLHQTSMVTPVNEDSFAVVRVESLEAEKLKPLAVVKNEVSAVWYNEQKEQWAHKTANELAALVRDNKPIAAAMKTVVETSNISIDKENSAELGDEVIEKVLTLTKGEVTPAMKSANKDEYYVIRIDNLVEADAKTLAESRAEIEKAYSRMQGEYLLMAYLDYARSRNKISINRKLLK